MVLIASSLIGSTLKDVSYSIKQNGIMVNLDYSEPIDDDDIIGWKSDRGWVYLTLLGVRAPKNKVVNQGFSGDVRKIVIDDFDESTQLAILIRKPILGYDIINSNTSPSTIVFIHTEMKKSEVANLKQHIEKQGSSVFNVAKSSGFPKYNTNFKNAFDEARKELGPNAIFEYHGKLYTTNHPGEKEALSKSILMKKSIGPIRDGDFDSFTLRSINEKSIGDSLLEEIYINKSTGELLTEKIGEQARINDNDLDNLYKKQDKDEDDGWFSGEFPTYSDTKKESPIPSQQPIKIDTVIQIEKPVLVESLSKNKKNKLKNWKNIFNIFKRNKNGDNKDQTKNNVVLADLKETGSGDLQESTEVKQNNYSSLQKDLVPPHDQNIQMRSIDESGYVISETQLSDTNVVQPFKTQQLSEAKRERFHELQKQYIPTELYYQQDTLGFLHAYEPTTQEPDTNIVEAWFTDESLISEDYDARHLQKEHVPLQNKNTELYYQQDTLGFLHAYEPPTQEPDTNIVEAWFTDESLIPEDYDARHLQKEHVPLKNKNMVFKTLEDMYLEESKPQTPEYTDPIILDKRLKTTYKNKNLIQKPKRTREKPFQPNNKEENTWLSYFPTQSDSVKGSLKWDFKEENQVPPFLQGQREVLDYSSSDNGKYRWKESFPNDQLQQTIKRQADPAFMYYYNGGIRVEANMAGVPIYIDGKYVGETPLDRPIQVEPGWHQVSGFSPLYTHLASAQGLQFINYDSIIQNNEMYGATTVYAEAGKLETVELRFNKMGDKPKRLSEMQGGMNIGAPMLLFLIGMVSWAM